MTDEVAVSGIEQQSESASDESGGIDMDNVSNDLAGELFSSSDLSTSEGDVDDVDADLTANVGGDGTEGESKDKALDGNAVDAGVNAEGSERKIPSTWPKEMYAHWKNTPKEVQEYWELRESQMNEGLQQYKGEAQYGRAMREAVTPYMALIQAQGIDAPQAVQTLLNAHYKLSVSSPSQKLQYLDHIARQYGVDLGTLNTLRQDGEEGQQAVDPRLVQLQDELHQLKQVIHSGTEQQLNAERIRIGNEVSTFASDPSHPYFDEVADDIIIMLKAGLPLQDAYDRAVWANPVTRAKETARLQTEAKTEAEKSARGQAEAAKKAASTNIRNRDTRRAPTEKPRGTMRELDDAMREAMREIKSQTH